MSALPSCHKAPAHEASSAAPKPDDGADSPSGGLSDGPREHRVIGYFTNWAHQRSGPCAFRTTHVDGALFTHLNYAFAYVSPGKNTRESSTDPSYELVPSSPEDVPRLYREVNGLKQTYPHLKTLLSVGGWTHNDPPLEWIFSAMAQSAETRASFVRQAIAFVRTHGFDGIDLDWEYPGAPERGGRPEDRDNFSALLREFRAEIAREARDSGRDELLLTIAAPAGSESLRHYDLAAIHPSLDWINVMTYDYNGEWSAATGANAPLAGDGENVTRTIDLYLDAGVPAHKLVLGMPTYARGWTRVEGTLPGSPALGKAPLGACGSDSLRSHEVAEWVRSGRMRGGWDPTSQTPYAFSEEEGAWLTYENARSYAAKVRFLRERGLGGAMFWAIDLDDFERGFPLIGQVARALLPQRFSQQDARSPAETATAQLPGE